MERKVPWGRWLGLLGTPLLLSPILILASQYPPARCAFVVLVMAVYWTLELLPLPVTSLLPVVLFPILGVSDTNSTAMVYMKGVQMMYIGSLMVALAVEESGLHRRIALSALSLAGTRPAFLMLGFMLPTAFLSMWISNAATSAMMVPIIQAVLSELALDSKQQTMMFLALAYSANIGGTGTIIGTPPNLILVGFLTSQFPEHSLNFGSWMAFALPEVVLNLAILWIVLQIYFTGWRSFADLWKKSEGKSDGEVRAKELIREKCKALGPLTFHEISVLVVFCLLVLLWFFRKPGFIPGWASALQWSTSSGSPLTIGSASATLLIVILLFVIPADPYKDPAGATLLEWRVVERKFPWGIILLMGGGFALAEGASKSCLTHLVGSVLSNLSALPPSLILLLLCLITSAISQIASNSATTSMLAPVVLSMASPLGLHPVYLALGVTLTASHAFMLPVSTPCNAIVFNAGGFTIKDMAGVGVILNLLCICSTMICLHTYGIPLLGLDSVPTWANVTVIQTNNC